MADGGASQLRNYPIYTVKIPVICFAHFPFFARGLRLWDLPAASKGSRKYTRSEVTHTHLVRIVPGTSTRVRPYDTYNTSTGMRTSIVVVVVVVVVVVLTVELIAKKSLVHGHRSQVRLPKTPMEPLQEMNVVISLLSPAFFWRVSYPTCPAI